jgi:hypothetical protein
MSFMFLMVNAFLLLPFHFICVIFFRLLLLVLLFPTYPMYRHLLSTYTTIISYTLYPPNFLPSPLATAYTVTRINQ